MKKHYLLAALVVSIAAAVTLNAQGGGRGRGAAATAQAKNVPAPTSPVTGNAVNGKQLYYNYGCYACHGYNGETGARPFVGRWGNLSTEQSFITFLRGRANVAPLTPSTSMPNFSEASMPDKQAKDIYAYIRSFKSSAPADAKDAPALNAIVEAAKRDQK
jgi:mono/diheme cytochrome c family protein